MAATDSERDRTPDRDATETNTDDNTDADANADGGAEGDADQRDASPFDAHEIRTGDLFDVLPELPSACWTATTNSHSLGFWICSAYHSGFRRLLPYL